MEMLSLSLGMYWMIPTLAFAVATMSGYAASSMMSGISGIASAGVSSSAAEAASGSASFGNVRAMTYNTNKYDAATSWSEGNKLSTVYSKETKGMHADTTEASKLNTQIERDKIEHEGSTWVLDKNGKMYEVNGSFTSTAGGWKGEGTIAEYDKNGKLLGVWDGKLSGSGNMNSYIEDFRVGGGGKPEDAYIATEVVKTELNKGTSHRTVNERTEKDILDTRDQILSGSETKGGNSTNIDNSYTKDNSVKLNDGIKINEANTVEGYGGARSSLKGENRGDVIKHITNTNSNFKESFVQNQTEVLNSIARHSGQTSFSLESQEITSLGTKASMGLSYMGTGVSFDVSDITQSISKQGKSEITAGDLNRLAVEQITDKTINAARTMGKTPEEAAEMLDHNLEQVEFLLKSQVYKSTGADEPRKEDMISTNGGREGESRPLSKDEAQKAWKKTNF